MVRSWQLSFDQDMMNHTSKIQRIKHGYGFPTRKTFSEPESVDFRSNLLKLGNKSYDSEIRYKYRNSDVENSPTGSYKCSSSRVSVSYDKSQYGNGTRDKNKASAERSYQDNKYFSLYKRKNSENKDEQDLKRIKIVSKKIKSSGKSDDKSHDVKEHKKFNQSSRLTNHNSEKKKVVSLNDKSDHNPYKKNDLYGSQYKETVSVFPAKSTYKESKKSPKDLREFRMGKSEHFESLNRKNNNFDNNENRKLSDINDDRYKSSTTISSSSCVKKTIKKIYEKNYSGATSKSNVKHVDDSASFDGIKKYRKDKSERPKNIDINFDIDGNNELPDLGVNNISSNICSPANVCKQKEVVIKNKRPAETGEHRRKKDNDSSSSSEARAFRISKSKHLEDLKNKYKSINIDDSNDLPDINVSENILSTKKSSSSYIYNQKELGSENKYSAKTKECSDKKVNEPHKSTYVRENGMGGKSEQPTTLKNKTKYSNISRHQEYPDINIDGSNLLNNIDSSLKVYEQKEVVSENMHSGETREVYEKYNNNNEDRYFDKKDETSIVDPNRKSSVVSSITATIDKVLDDTRSEKTSKIFGEQHDVHSLQTNSDIKEQVTATIDKVIVDACSEERSKSSEKIHDFQSLPTNSVKAEQITSTIDKVHVDAASEKRSKICEEKDALNSLQTHSDKNERKSKIKSHTQIADHSKLSINKKFKYSTKLVDTLKPDSCWVCQNNFTDPVDDHHLFFGEIKCRNCNLWIRSCTIYKGFLNGEIENGCLEHSFKWSYIDSDTEKDEYNILSIYLEKTSHLKNIRFYKKAYKHFYNYFLNYNTHSHDLYSSDENTAKHNSVQSHQGPIKMCISNIDGNEFRVRGNENSLSNEEVLENEDAREVHENFHSTSISKSMGKCLEDITDTNLISNSDLQEYEKQNTVSNSLFEKTENTCNQLYTQEISELFQKLPSYARDNCVFTNIVRDCCVNCNTSWDLSQCSYICGIDVFLHPCNNCGIFTCYFLNVIDV